MKFEIRRCANGFIVMPCEEYGQRGVIDFEKNVRVFKTWGQASWWLDREFKGKK